MRKIKKIVATLLAATMVMAMGVTAFAADSSHSAKLYKDGTYETGSPVESMGNGAIDGAEVTQRADGKYVVTVDFKTSFKAMGFTGYLKSVTLDDYTLSSETDIEKVAANSYIVTKDGKKVNAVKLVLDNEPAYPFMLHAIFTISVSIMPVNASGDIVVY